MDPGRATWHLEGMAGVADSDSAKGYDQAYNGVMKAIKDPTKPEGESYGKLVNKARQCKADVQGVVQQLKA